MLCLKIDADNYEAEGKLAKIRAERGYTYSDQLECCPQRLENYLEKIKSFFTEHIHSDEEIRFVLDGSGYFDVRDNEDKWIRILVEKGDLLILPAGIYHRFTLDNNVLKTLLNIFINQFFYLKDYIKVIRLFVGEPIWTPINRPADTHPARVHYLQTIESNV